MKKIGLFLFILAILSVVFVSRPVFADTEFAYSEKMPDGTEWLAYGKGEVFRQIEFGNKVVLENAAGEKFTVVVVEIMSVPGGNLAKNGIWFQFELQLTEKEKEEIQSFLPQFGSGHVTIVK